MLIKIWKMTIKWQMNKNEYTKEVNKTVLTHMTWLRQY